MISPTMPMSMISGDSLIFAVMPRYLADVLHSGAGAFGVLSGMALIKALQERTILSAGLDVYLREPEVPPELIAMDNVVLFPHLGSASVTTRSAGFRISAWNSSPLLVHFVTTTISPRRRLRFSSHWRSIIRKFGCDL